MYLFISRKILRKACHLQNVCPQIRVFSTQKSLYQRQVAAGICRAASNAAKLKESPQVQTEAEFLTINSKTKTIEPLVILKEKRPNNKIKKEETWREIKVSLSDLPQHYLKLSKSRLTSLVVITSMAGYAMSPAPFDPLTFAFCTLGTGLVSSAANSINQFLEIPFDAQMSRTKSRVLVKGYLTPLHAVGFAAFTATAGLSMLYFGTNGLTAALGATNLALYTMVYTPLKRISILNTWVGSIVGAIPPLMGWAACQGSLGAGAFVMAALLYAWQFPHFNALSWNLRPDYSRAGYRMMAVTNPGLCRRTALRYTLALTALSGVAPLLDVTNWYFAALSLPVNGYFVYLATKFYQESDSGSSRRLFRFSLLHLPLLMGLLLVTKKDWFINSEKSSSDNIIVEEDSSLLQLGNPRKQTRESSICFSPNNISVSVTAPNVALFDR